MVYVNQLDENVQAQIRIDLEIVIRETGIYTEEEINGNVELGMESKLVDLADTIDISKYK